MSIAPRPALWVVTFVSPNCLVPLQMYPFLYSGCVYLYIASPVSVTVTCSILQYCRASLILVNCCPFGRGGWFPRLSNTGVIKPAVSQRRACGALATSTLQSFLVFFKFSHKITALDYCSGAPPSAHCPPSVAQCGRSPTYCPAVGAVSALRA